MVGPVKQDLGPLQQRELQDLQGKDWTHTDNATRSRLALEAIDVWMNDPNALNALNIKVDNAASNPNDLKITGIEVNGQFIDASGEIYPVGVKPR